MSTLYKREDSTYWWWSSSYKGKRLRISTGMRQKTLAQKIQSEWDMKLLNPHQVANILAINYRKVLDLINLKKLPAIKIERQYRIKESDLYAFIEDNRV